MTTTTKRILIVDDEDDIREAAQARLLDMQSHLLPPVSIGADWAIDLPPAGTHYAGDPPGYYFIGGEPRLLVEEDVPFGAPVAPPRVG